jgi:hypothetical protein
MSRHWSFPWLHSAAFDGALVVAPAWLATAAVLAWPGRGASGPVGPLAWLVLVVALDVAHVYATLFRTYLDRRERREHRALLAFVPLACLAGAAGLHSLGSGAFWTVLAYVAVFHFVRQQYGLVKLYAGPGEAASRLVRAIDGAMVSAATLYPLVWWHAHLPRSFAWFVDGDFVPLPAAAELAGRVAYAAVATAWAASLAWRLAGGQAISVPRQLLVLGSAVSWWVGIVGRGGDLAFTVTNVVAHAVPYFALVWLYGANRESRERRRRWFVPLAAPLLLGFLVLLAYVEEGLWDGLVWQEHAGLFPAFAGLPTLEGAWADVVIAALILPQLTHYVLDGFIWRLGADATWRETLFWRRPGARA